MEKNTQQSVIKIAVVGPESTGKTTLSKQLAEHYNTAWVPEFARSYCEKLSEPCTLEDERKMFYGQLALEKKICRQAKHLFICDTTFMNVKIWSDRMFGQCPQEVLEALPRHTYDFYLLMDIDLEWEDDPLRDFPTEREYFLEIWKKELERIQANYQLINGQGKKRLQHACKAIDDFLNTNKQLK